MNKIDNPTYLDTVDVVGSIPVAPTFISFRLKDLPAAALLRRCPPAATWDDLGLIRSVPSGSRRLFARPASRAYRSSAGKNFMELIHETVRYRCFADAVCHHARGTQTVRRSIFRTLSKAITLGDYFS